MMRFYLLASGSKGNAFVLEDGTSHIMIDCGSTWKYLKSSMAETGFDLNELDALIITHTHSDHISQIRHFTDIPIYAPVHIEDADNYLVRPLRNFTIESLQFTPIPLSHDAPETTGYIIDSGAEKLVYVTDTGYINEKYLPRMEGADYIVMESNHDVDMLMRTHRPQYLKSRIYSDSGHLCNEQCAEVLDRIVTENTKMILLAHISQEANTREKALEVSSDYLLRYHRGPLHKDLIIAAAGQFEIAGRGGKDEEVDPGTCSRALGVERMAYIPVD